MSDYLMASNQRMSGPQELSEEQSSLALLQGEHQQLIAKNHEVSSAVIHCLQSTANCRQHTTSVSPEG